MRIINRKAFLELPSGIVYCKYTSLGCFGDICIKGNSTGYDDWWYLNIVNGWEGCDGSADFHNLMSDAEGGAIDIRNDLECDSRDGLFEEDQLFCVYDATDIQDLINKLVSLQKMEI